MKSKKLLDYVKFTLNTDEVITHNSLMRFCRQEPHRVKDTMFLIAQRAVDIALEDYA